MRFVISGAQPDMDVIDITAAAEGSKATSAAALNSKLANFRLDNAHCYDPNEV